MPDGAGRKVRPLSWVMAAQQCSKLPERGDRKQLGVFQWSAAMIIFKAASNFLQTSQSTRSARKGKARVTEGAGCMWLSPLARTAQHSLRVTQHRGRTPEGVTPGQGVKHSLANRDGQLFSVDFLHPVNMAQTLKAVPKEQCSRSMD